MRVRGAYCTRYTGLYLSKSQGQLTFLVSVHVPIQCFCEEMYKKKY